MRCRPNELAAALALLLASALPARAEEPKADEEDLDITAGAARAAGADARTRELTLHLGGGFTAPAGSLARDVGSGELISIGPSVGGSAEVGLSRYVGIQVGAGFASFSEPHEGCDGCGGTSFDLGLSLVYHLSQGIAIDPWTSFGVGYRSFSIEVPAESYTGIDVAKIALGADFRPAKSFGFGPTLELDLGTTLDRPAGRRGSVHAMFLVGLRLSFDPFEAFGGGSTAGQADRATVGWAPLPLSL